MAKKQLSLLLVVEDSKAQKLKKLLALSSYREAKVFDTSSIKELKTNHFDLIITDLKEGIAKVETLLDFYEDTALLYLGDDDALALAALGHGVHEYLPLKELTADLLGRSLDFALKRAAIEATLKESSFTDDLTGLYNRRGFRALTEHAMKMTKRTKQGFILFMLDLDYFKKINDLYGHAEGDKMIIAVARCLSNSFRAGDIIGRIGGDEFAILVLGGTPETESHLRLNLIENLKTIKSRGNRGVHCSVGATYFQGEEVSLDELFKKVDSALYEEKSRHHSKLVGLDERM